MKVNLETIGTTSFKAVVPNYFHAIPFLEIPPPAHSPRGQWLQVGRREALTGKTIFQCRYHLLPPLNLILT